VVGRKRERKVRLDRTGGRLFSFFQKAYRVEKICVYLNIVLCISKVIVVLLVYISMNHLPPILS
jgi:hypothetical protein